MLLNLVGINWSWRFFQETYVIKTLLHISSSFQVSQVPSHGALVLDNRRQTRLGDSFSQSDVDRGLLSFHHDHSDTREDHFGVSIFMEGNSNGGGDVLLYSGVWNITVLPVNDQVRFIDSCSFLCSNIFPFYIISIFWGKVVNNYLGCQPQSWSSW